MEIGSWELEERGVWAERVAFQRFAFVASFLHSAIVLAGNAAEAAILTAMGLLGKLWRCENRGGKKLPGVMHG